MAAENAAHGLMAAIEPKSMDAKSMDAESVAPSLWAHCLWTYCDAASGGRRTLQLVSHLRGDGAIDRRMRPVGLTHHHRRAGIRHLADRHVQRHLAEERHLE